MSEIYFIDHYDSFSLNLVDWLKSLDSELIVHFLRFDDADLYKTLIREPKPLVFSPGPKSPADASQSKFILKKFIGRVPVLGICLGHQLLGDVLGMEIHRSVQPVHGSLVDIRKTPSPSQLLAKMPDQFQVARYNSLVLLEKGPVEGLYVTSRTEKDEIMSIEFRKHGDYPAFGIQFHPESFLMNAWSTPILSSWLDVVSNFYLGVTQHFEMSEMIQ